MFSVRVRRRRRMLLYILVISSFVLTLCFWMHTPHNCLVEEDPVNQRSERNLWDRMTSFDWSTDTKGGVPKQPALVCPEFDIPGLVGTQKPNMSDISIHKVERMIFGDRLKSIKRLVTKTNRLINQTRQPYIINSNSSSAFKSCANVASAWEKCGNVHLQDVLRYNSMAMLEVNYTYMPGGLWRPTDCLPRWKVAIVIPYRNRSHHLPILLRYLTPRLQRQKLEFGFYVVEQANDLNFNRAMLMNIGFLESLNFSQWDCFIFHDVDHIPLSDYNYYGCSGMPRHFLSGADRWKYRMPYNDFFGAVTGLARGQIYRINGFPNVYWGWGGEDDEILSRIRELRLEVTRAKGRVGYYNVIQQHHHSAPPVKHRFQILKTYRSRMKKDGLNNLVYKKPLITLHTLYTNISVDIQRLKVNFDLPKNPKLPVNRTNAAVKNNVVPLNVIKVITFNATRNKKNMGSES